MDELLEQFLIEGRELVAQAGKDFAALSRDATDVAAIDSAFRAIHTLKGSVVVFDLGPAERLLHAAEDLLERVRKGTCALEAAETDALVASLDEVDRWIDDMERDGRLSEDAPAKSEQAIARLRSRAAEPPSPDPVMDKENWLARLSEREAAIIAGAAGPVVAFCYAPDADCFFRGEDPLAVAEAVPNLLTLTMLPRDGAWPSATAIEPFSCFGVLEGLSSASPDRVRAAFRLQPDQVQFAELTSGDRGEIARTSRVDTSVLRVASARVDAMADGLADLAVAINGLAPLAEDAQGVDHALAARIRAVQATIERAMGSLHRNLTAVRLVPLEPALQRLPRLTREIAQSLGKSVTLTIAGERIEVDKQIADGLFEPLLHMVRNAIDHGIEAVEVRRAAGKPQEGRIALSFAREGDAVVATLSDDGAGIDPKHIRQLAVARDLLPQDAAEVLTDAAALRLIFAPGFSTAGTVTEVSGRGVGMDAVQAAIDRLRGSIEIDSTAGQGTIFSIRLPANALTTQLLVVEVGGERYGVALDQVVETVRIDRSVLFPVGRGIACVLRDRTVPVLDLATLLDARRAEGPHAKLVVTQSRGEPIALRVDDFAERIDTIVRPPTGMLSSARGVIGSALMGDGSVLLVLDLPDLAA
ncbi:chemotaxis protein CheA (plasmid) [Novosphingobium resinovorum]|uniref:chemotaxis protein CheA n=1 Tax=Novosphingobium TaxID=165696 RepID=UPI001B3C6841|nr:MULTISPECIES: chemotaxis protein CheA [Novosphingobium]MBF7015560.1 chemotaxis protein CheA [Novosphingobium sp. HR1a]WJM30236.1 chemotaxis protein CheA [Novosphingobium resinovorum]